MNREVVRKTYRRIKGVCINIIDLIRLYYRTIKLYLARKI